MAFLKPHSRTPFSETLDEFFKELLQKKTQTYFLVLWNKAKTYFGVQKSEQTTLQHQKQNSSWNWFCPRRHPHNSHKSLYSPHQSSWLKSFFIHISLRNQRNKTNHSSYFLFLSSHSGLKSPLTKNSCFHCNMCSLRARIINKITIMNMHISALTSRLTKTASEMKNNS